MSNLYSNNYASNFQKKMLTDYYKDLALILEMQQEVWKFIFFLHKEKCKITWYFEMKRNSKTNVCLIFKMKNNDKNVEKGIKFSKFNVNNKWTNKKINKYPI